MASIERELSESSLRKVKFLAGLLDRHPGPAIEDAALEALGYPALWVTANAEAVAIMNHLEKAG